MRFGVKHFILISTFILTFFETQSFAFEYKLDESHTQIGFKIKHLMISNVSGRFNKFNGNFEYDSKSKKLINLKVIIDVGSIDTNEPDRDKHLKSKDFFDVENVKFKSIEFIAKETIIKDSTITDLNGELTVHGIKKPIVLKVEFKGEVTDPWGNTKAIFEAHTKLNRKDFGLNWNKNLDHGGLMIADEVEINIEGEANLQKPTK